MTPADLIARARLRFVAGGDPLLGELADALEVAQSQVKRSQDIIDEWMGHMSAMQVQILRRDAVLKEASDLIGGLFCPGCKAQGREMAGAGKCCRDIDCDAGFYGINCDEVKHVLEKIETVHTGTTQAEKDELK